MGARKAPTPPPDPATKPVPPPAPPAKMAIETLERSWRMTVEQVLFCREKGGAWEPGLYLNEETIIDYAGAVVVELWDYNLVPGGQRVIFHGKPELVMVKPAVPS